ncbi:ATP-binding protein [Variovorax ureilyticus]|uniref:histidine kinase n=1 Tax=Variovorax ureilyticus TaxID=1836198 RepID=A0ABU8VAE7_9BURK
MARTSASLRNRLLSMAIGAILPVALMSALALGAMLQNQRDEISQSTLRLARAIATAIDNELRLTAAALQALALVDQMREVEAGPGNLRFAHELAKSVRDSHPEWRGVVLAKPNGDVLFGTESQLGSVKWSVMEPDSFREAVRLDTPVVGPVTRGPRGTQGFTVRVPVKRGGELAYVLTAIVSPDAIHRVIERQEVPEGWVVSAFDSNNVRVARSHRNEESFGTRPGPTLEALLAGMGTSNEATGFTSTVEGQKVRSAVVRIPWAGWTIALGAPTSALNRSLWSSGSAYGGGLAISLLLAALAAWQIARSIARPVAALRDDAKALGQGLPITGASTGIGEIDEVSEALVEAATLRGRQEAEREELLTKTLAARGAAVAAQRRLQILANASDQLSHSLEESAVLESIGSIVVPQIADFCRIDLMDERGVLQRKLTHHSDPLRAETIREFVANRTSSAETPGSFPYVVKTGDMYTRNLEPGDLAEFNDPSFRHFAELVGLRAVCAVPLIARGRTIGAMAALQAESGRHFAAEDAALIAELAHRTALALDNVRMFSESEVALKHAQVANRAKDEFLAMLGHELRNPLAPIIMALELMKRRDPTAFAREREMIDRQARHLVRMVDDLLDVSRIAAGKIKLNFENVDLEQVIGRALELCAPAFEKRDPPRVVLPAKTVHVRGDALRLTQVLCNLLTNASKFTPRDKGIVVELSPDGSEALLTVTDEGQGISSALLPHVFEQFVQGEQGLSRSSGGLGLGLAIAKNVVEQHGGTIRADSAGPGQGSCFTIRLPALRVNEPMPSRPLDGAASLAAAARPRRILVVDDNADAAESLAGMLVSEGHEVRTASSAVQALEVLRNFDAEAALIDIGLPGMNGYELARALRADVGTRAMKLIALTGFGQESDRRQAIDAGYDTHLVKPARPEDIAKSLGVE